MGKRQYTKIGKKKRIDRAKKESVLFIDCSKYVSSIKVVCYINKKYEVDFDKIKTYCNRMIVTDIENDKYILLPLNKKLFLHFIGNGFKLNTNIKIELSETNKTYYEIEEDF